MLVFDIIKFKHEKESLEIMRIGLIDSTKWQGETNIFESESREKKLRELAAITESVLKSEA